MEPIRGLNTHYHCHLSAEMLKRHKCKEICDAVMDCSHRCEIMCHGLLPHQNCDKECEKTCPRGHRCSQACCEPCKPCQVKNTYILPCGHQTSIAIECCKVENFTCRKNVNKILDCEHLSTNLLCYQVKDYKCQLQVEHRLRCGHTTSVKCNTRQQEVEVYICKKPTVKTLKCLHKIDLPCNVNIDEYFCSRHIQKELECGHHVVGHCGAVVFNHKCKESVKKDLSCGHSSMLPCSFDPTDYKCEAGVIIQLDCSHEVTFKCYESKQKLSNYICELQTTFPLECGHRSEVMKCCEMHGNYKCERYVSKLLPCRIHRKTLECSQDVSYWDCRNNVIFYYQNCDHLTEPIPCEDLHDYVMPECPKICGKKKSCGHICEEKCHGRIDHDKFECEEVCEELLRCGHTLVRKCNEDRPSLQYKCVEDCIKPRSCGHKCVKMCHEKCGSCQVLVTIHHPICGHEFLFPCGEDLLTTTPCNILVQPDFSCICGATFKIPCHLMKSIKSRQDVSKYCESKCGAYFDPKEGGCGHYCPGRCKDCSCGRFHARCNVPCGKSLICTHPCLTTCKNCLSCTMKCQTFCPHKKQCELPCGVPCLNCMEPCTARCDHSSCTKLCHEPCDRLPCEKPCPEKLDKCGHPCIGFCGEECPELCRICDTEKLKKCLLKGEDEVEDEMRFVVLKNCKHTVESTALDTWMNIKLDNKEIIQMACPICKAVIGYNTRYATVLNENLKEVMEVKALLFGNREQVMSQQMDFYNELKRKGYRTRCPEFVEFLKDELRYNDESGAIKWKNISETVLNSIKTAAQILFESIETDYESVVSNVEEKYIRPMKQVHEEILEFIQNRDFPLRGSELVCIEKELNRAFDIKQLILRLSKKEPSDVRNLITRPESKKKFESAMKAVLISKEYGPKEVKRFRQHIREYDTKLTSKLQISEHEKRDILSVFNGPDGIRGAGRWFKCSCGYVYVVTECGGVTELGKCPTCGSGIGGENHRVIDGNELATEMDGALQPLYPTALLGNSDDLYQQAILESLQSAASSVKTTKEEEVDSDDEFGIIYPWGETQVAEYKSTPRPREAERFHRQYYENYFDEF